LSACLYEMRAEIITAIEARMSENELSASEIRAMDPEKSPATSLIMKRNEFVISARMLLFSATLF